MNSGHHGTRLAATWAIVEATHPRAVAVFSLLSLAVAAIAVRGLPPLHLTLGIIGAMVPVQVAIGLFNEYCDRDLDSLAKTDRALPRGLLSPQPARTAAWVSLTLGLGCASTLSICGALVLAVGAGMGFLYSARLKRTGWSWLPYAVAYPIVPLWVWVSLGVFQTEMLLIYPVVAPFAIGVHLCNQLRDYDDDVVQGMRGLAQYLGKQTAGMVCLVLLTLAPLLTLAALRWQGHDVAAVWATTILHWLLTADCLIRHGSQDDVRRWRGLFQRLQISGPALLVSLIAALSP